MDQSPTNLAAYCRAANVAAAMRDNRTKLIFADIETRGLVDVTVHGLYRHADDEALRLLCVSYAIGDGEIKDWRLNFADGVNPEAADPMPDDLREALEDPDTLFVAWNAAYERVVLNAVRKHYPGLPYIHIEKMICAAALAAAHNLPRSLEQAAKAVLPSTNQKGSPSSWMWHAGNELRPEHAEEFGTKQVGYCNQDVGVMRDIYHCLTQPTMQFMPEYWAAEYINDRGVLFDTDLIEGAARLEPFVKAELKQELDVITGGNVKLRGPSFGNWLESELPEELVPMLTVNKKRQKGTKWWTEKRRSTDKGVRAALLAELDEWEGCDDLRDGIRIYGEANQTGATKYLAAQARMDPDEGCLRGQFMFTGAAQTGRFSAHGIQVHNLIRTVPKNAIELMEAIKTKTHHEIPQISGMSVGKTLSQCVRTGFMAEDGKMFSWCDWSAIEARMLPWLTGEDAPVLDLFRRGEDVYVAEAAGILNKAPEDITPAERQSHGKVPILALGYQGAIGAFKNMARAYGVEMSDVEINNIVKTWRRKNDWAVRFWKALMKAATSALEQPGRVFVAGRIRFVFLKALLGGTLIAELPCGRMLFYRRARFEQIDKDGKTSRALIFEHPQFGVGVMYGGHIAENVTQAASASLLRRALVRCQEEGLEVVLHVHDEIMIEADVSDIQDHGQILQNIMDEVPDWASGLPLGSEVEFGFRYKINAEVPMQPLDGNEMLR